MWLCDLVAELLPFYEGCRKTMGFFRRQEERMAVHYLTWQYQKMNLPVPMLAALERHAKKIVDEAHRVGAERSRNVMGIIKESVEDLKKSKTYEKK